MMDESNQLKTKTTQLKSAKKWKDGNPEKVKEYAKKYYIQNREKMREQYQAKTLEKNILKLEKLTKMVKKNIN